MYQLSVCSVLVVTTYQLCQHICHRKSVFAWSLDVPQRVATRVTDDHSGGADSLRNSPRTITTLHDEQPSTSGAMRYTASEARGLSRLHASRDQDCYESDGDQDEGISDEKLQKQLKTVTDEKEIKRIKR
jgi:hypothetical protein